MGNGNRAGVRLRCGVALIVALLGTGRALAETPAGTPVVNGATLAATIDGVPNGAASNSDRFLVDERLDVALAALPTAGTLPVVLLTNAGNGQEAFDLALEQAAGEQRLAIDRDGDGRFDPAVDVALDPAAPRTPPLAPGASLRLLLLAPATGIVARAATGSGEPGTVFAGLGDRGGDGVVGPTTARARLPLGQSPDADTTRATLAKSQTVTAPDGSDAVVSGAVITYRLEAQVEAGVARETSVDDPIPLGTHYRPNSLTLDGAALTDAADADPGSFADNRITVSLGDVTAPGRRIVQFQVTID